MAKRRFRFLEHTADVYIEACGSTLEEAFENAALATMNVMTEAERVAPRFEDSVEVEAHDEYALLYNWIEELLIRFETAETLYSCFKVSSIEVAPDVLRLKAKIWGEPFDPEKHLQKVGVKAITYHRMEILRKTKQVTVKFILDI
ncbi:MAG: archease [Candidatus Bathyarchaeota archaeon]|nr:MAG: archease [Candidatus Bathyarchaeota archaeon]